MYAVCISFGSAALRCESTACHKILWSLSAYVVAIDALTIAVGRHIANSKGLISFVLPFWSIIIHSLRATRLNSVCSYSIPFGKVKKHFARSKLAFTGCHQWKPKHKNQLQFCYIYIYILHFLFYGVFRFVVVFLWTRTLATHVANSNRHNKREKC